MINNPTKILIIGAGAIGGFYGAKLADAGAEVSIICRSDYEFIKENGFTIKSHWHEKEFNFKPHKVLRSVAEYEDKADFILVTTKVLPESSAIDLIKPVLYQNSSIVLLQNGIHIEKPVAAAFPNNHLISILAFIAVSRVGTGKIYHQDYGRLIIGDFPNGISKKTEIFIELLEKSGVPCETSSEIQKERWRKLVWNAAFNPISVIAGGIDTRKILDNENVKNLAKNVMQEVAILAKADGHELPQDIVANNIRLTEEMKPYKTSMLLDFEAKRPMEVEAILGNAVKFSKEKSIASPYLSTLYALLSCY
ncbi:MAG: 2-dehydropantoate 2-reductase [Rickettsiales bacterium]|nr:2-dehydropantoate 2-reductase [Rickettsiales bacterium]